MLRRILALVSVVLAASAFASSEINYAVAYGDYTSPSTNHPTAGNIRFAYKAVVDSSNPQWFKVQGDPEVNFTWSRSTVSGSDGPYGGFVSDTWYFSNSSATGGMLDVYASNDSWVAGFAETGNPMSSLVASQYFNNQNKSLTIFFVIDGDEPLDVMIRATTYSIYVDPSTTYPHDPTTLYPTRQLDPKVSLYDSNQSLLTSNETWHDGNNWVTVQNIHTQLGLPMLDSSGDDACILATLQPGEYYVNLTSELGWGGVVLDVHPY